ncbi:MAG: IS66 family transposase, partial [Methanothrix sp.]
NGSEIALREGVIKRKISYGTRSESGKAAWENQLTILDTCRKQGVSYFEYILDIISGSYSMPRLSQLLMRSKSSTAY